MLSLVHLGADESSDTAYTAFWDDDRPITKEAYNAYMASVEASKAAAPVQKLPKVPAWAMVVLGGGIVLGATLLITNLSVPKYTRQPA